MKVVDDFRLCVGRVSGDWLAIPLVEGCTIMAGQRGSRMLRHS